MTTGDLPELKPDDLTTTPAESLTQTRARGRGLQLLPNPYLVGLAHAVLLAPGEIDTITALGGTLPEDLALVLDSRVRAGFEQCNNAYYRYDLRYVDSVSEATTLTVEDAEVIRSRLGDDSTIKLVMLLPLSTNGPGTESDLGRVRVPSFHKERPLTLGEAVLAPSFVEPVFDLPVDTTLTCLSFLAYGPAFR